MSSRFNFEAERAADILVRSSRPLPNGLTKNWEQDFVNPNKPTRYIPDSIHKFPPRIIRIVLESEHAQSVSSSTMTWILRLDTIGPLREGSVLTVRDLNIAQGDVSIDTQMEVGLSGFNVHRYAVGSTQHDFRIGLLAKTTNPNLFSIPGTCSLSATMRDTVNGLSNRTITLSRISGGLPWNNTVVRLGLQISEPGSHLF